MAWKNGSASKPTPPRLGSVSLLKSHVYASSTTKVLLNAVVPDPPFELVPQAARTTAASRVRVPTKTVRRRFIFDCTSRNPRLKICRSRREISKPRQYTYFLWQWRDG